MAVLVHIVIIFVRMDVFRIKFIEIIANGQKFIIYYVYMRGEEVIGEGRVCVYPFPCLDLLRRGRTFGRNWIILYHLKFSILNPLKLGEFRGRGNF